MSSDPLGFDSDPFSDDHFGSSVGIAQGKTGRSWRLVGGALSAVVASVTLLVSLVGAPGYGAVVVCALTYLLAVWVDLDERDKRFKNRNYSRPRVTASLRSATFLAALWVAWLAASSLAGAT